MFALEIETNRLQTNLSLRQPAVPHSFEYDGIIRAGIKADQATISEPDSDGIITVTFPAATILSYDLDEETIREIDSESPLWGFVPLYSAVNIEDRRAAIVAAQEDMVASASQNAMVLSEAQDRARRVIKKTSQNWQTPRASSTRSGLLMLLKHKRLLQITKSDDIPRCLETRL